MSEKKKIPPQEELTVLYRELEEKNRKLSELDELKDEFISNVSHELRTPLSIIKEGVSLVADQVVGQVDPRQTEILQMVTRNIDRLEHIIKNLLDISMIQKGEVRLNRSMMNVAELVTLLVNFYRPHMADKRLDLIVDMPKTDIYTFADTERIYNAFSHILSNSIKFTSKGYIRISLRDTENEIQCHVSDTGLGFSRDQLESLFEKFRQYDRKHGPGERGTGLGLSIAKEIVKLHGGDINVESEKNKGTTVCFSLPKSVRAVCLNAMNARLVCVRETGDGEKPSVILVEITDAVEIRERYGDTGAAKVFNILKDMVGAYVTRPGDVLAASYPGELMILLPQTGAKGAIRVSEKIKEAALSRHVVFGEEKIPLNIKVGIAEYSADGRTAGELVDKAFSRLA
ncbi:MAG: diguanylate cyclase [Candidatus Omnitrophica bacterium]|nr:diguanylate cyclase [Candidatus Omnitrophota bacterium]